MSGQPDESVGDAAYTEVEKTLLGRWPEHRIAPTLERINALVYLMGDPHRAAPMIHLTGTNGKTSTARMIDALLRACDLRTGRFTSPHLESMRERICLDGEPLSAERFVEVYAEISGYVVLVDGQRETPMSFFEIIAGMAFAAFADAPIDAGVIEVGLGGSWDATNVIDAVVPVVLPVALDHTQYLGTQPAQIAEEKAGIIKPGSTVVLAQQEVEVAEVMVQRAAETGSTLAREGLEFGVLDRQMAVGGQQVTVQGLHTTYSELFLPLHGIHQAHNAAVALATVEAFLTGEGSGTAGLDPELVQDAFSTVSAPARLEVVRRSPTIVLDSAHNPHGARASAEAVTESFDFNPLVAVVGVMADKDAFGLLEVFEPIVARIVCTQNSTERAMPAAELAELAAEVFGEDRVERVERLDDAIDTAVRIAEEDSVALGSGGVLISGSVVTAGEARTLLGKG